MTDKQIEEFTLIATKRVEKQLFEILLSKQKDFKYWLYPTLEAKVDSQMRSGSTNQGSVYYNVLEEEIAFRKSWNTLGNRIICEQKTTRVPIKYLRDGVYLERHKFKNIITEACNKQAKAWLLYIDITGMAYLFDLLFSPHCYKHSEVKRQSIEEIRTKNKTSSKVFHYRKETAKQVIDLGINLGELHKEIKAELAAEYNIAEINNLNLFKVNL